MIILFFSALKKADILFLDLFADKSGNFYNKARVIENPEKRNAG